MAYPSFPNIALPLNVYDEEPEDRGIISKMDNGSEVSRAKFTVSRLTFTLNWSAMSAADKATLQNFYRNTVAGCGSAFTWVHPDPSSEHYNHSFDVRIVQPPKFTKVPPDKFATQLILRGIESATA